MAPAQSLTCLSLFSGIGGLELGVSRALGGRLRTLGYVERSAYAAAVLLARMEDQSLEPAPVWCGDLAELDCAPFEGVDLVTAGAPCQPYSVAGKQKGDDDDRYLWPAIFDIIEAVRPALVFLENVPALLSWFRPIGERLCGLGYEFEATLCRASDVGAPHKRERLLVLAHRDEAGRGVLRGHVPEHGDAAAGDDADRRGGAEGELEHAAREQHDGSGQSGQGRRGQPSDASGCVGDPECGAREQHRGDDVPAGAEVLGSGRCTPMEWPPGPSSDEWRSVLAVRPDLAPALAHGSGARRAGAQDAGADSGDAGEGGGRGEPERSVGALADAQGHGRGQPEPEGGAAAGGAGGPEREAAAQPEIHELANGIPADMDRAMSNRTHRLRALGNAVVPQCAEMAFRELMERIR